VNPAIDGQPAYNRAGPALPLAPGTRIGVYEITASLGAGGMGEVYRARDWKLKREVAIKVLPADVANDPERLARFQREAEVLASLNHPHIAHVYGTEDRALVMELVEGEDLAERIARGPIPIDEALPIARQIAEALEAAHDAGIIHRDLKPANVKVRSDGTVKVLDFGLAKALGHDLRTSGPQDLANSPTITSPAMTMGGMILGTAAYMSPEQAKGKPVDKRADIWAFGCVLYEMLTGKRAFKGDDVTDIITSVMRDTPDWLALPFETPSAIRTLLRRCIEKDPRKRAPHMAIARMEIDDAMTSTGELVQGHGGERPARAKTRLVAAVALAVGVTAIAGGWALARYTAGVPAPAQPVRFHLDAPVSAAFGQRNTAFLAVAPDGTRVAYVVQPRGRAGTVWIHSFIDGTSRELPSTAGAASLFWSPDGKHVGFFTARQLNRVDVTSGAVQTITEGRPGGSGTWRSDGTILFSDGVIKRVDANGGQPQPVTTLDSAKGDVRHLRPVFLPEGRRFLFTAINGEADKSTLQLAELGSSETRILDQIASGAEYVEPGYLVFARNAKLMARPFDKGTGAWTGDAVVVSETVRQQPLGTAAFSASVSGVIAYDGWTLVGENLDLEWVGRDGRSAGIFSRQSGGHVMALATDDNSVAIETAGGSGGNAVWILDGTRGTRTRLTFEKGAQGHPVWSPEGRRLVYFDGQPGATTRLLIKVANGTRDAEPLLGGNDQTPTNKQATDWSRDGRYVVYEEQSRDTGYDLKYVDLNGDRRPKIVVATPFAERMGQLSPDGRLIAYQSSEGAAEPEIYVATFPDASMRWAISNRGGAKPRWSADGRELVFVDLEGTLQSVAINVSGGFRPGVPVPLFPLNGINTDGYNYAMSRDATRFLIMRLSEKATPTRLNVIINWPATVQ
jgi:Tol biopolymer transport system component/predicted Ser/Thr protein kinase